LRFQPVGVRADQRRGGQNRQKEKVPPIDLVDSHGDNTAMILTPFGRETTFGISRRAKPLQFAFW
jgi:hypothetical protein